jgi:hypothetical protein
MHPTLISGYIERLGNNTTHNSIYCDFGGIYLSYVQYKFTTDNFYKQDLYYFPFENKACYGVQESIYNFSYF